MSARFRMFTIGSVAWMFVQAVVPCSALADHHACCSTFRDECTLNQRTCRHLHHDHCDEQRPMRQQQPVCPFCQAKTGAAALISPPTRMRPIADGEFMAGFVVFESNGVAATAICCGAGRRDLIPLRKCDRLQI